MELIDKNQAIEIVRDKCKRIPTCAILAMDAIDKLPVLQTEAKSILCEISDCVLREFGDCSYSETGCSDCAIKEKIRNALSIQSKHNRPHWIISSDGYYPYCSECKSEPKNGEMSDFCPKCGAWMRGEDVTQLPSVKPILSEEDKIICKMYLDDLDSRKSCNEYKILMRLLDSTARESGHWIVWGGMDIPENHGKHKCSVCGEFAPVRYEKPLIKENLSNFCPNCGSYNGGDNEEEE